MGSILNLHVITYLTLLVYAEVAHTIYNPGVTTTKLPKHRDSLPLYSTGENAQPPTNLSVLPEFPGITKIISKSWSNSRKYADPEIEQRTENHKTFNPDDRDDEMNQKQFQSNENESFHGIASSGTLEDRTSTQYLYRKDIKPKNNIPPEHNLYEGDTDDRNKPRKESIVGLSHHRDAPLIVAKYDSQNGVQCPFPDATGRFIYPIDCKFFVNCWKGRAFVQPCAPGTHFNPETLECDYPQKVKCYGGELADFISADYIENVGNREPLSNKHSVTHASYDNYSTPKCPEQITGLLPHPGDCTKFLQCTNGNAIVMSCGPGNVFNGELSICDYPRNVRGCEDAIGESDKPSFSLTPPEHSLSSYTRESNRNSWNAVPARQVVQTAVCPNDYVGMLPHPTDCKKFLQCNHGVAYIMDCAPGTVFNPMISVCDWSYNVPGCNDKPIPTFASPHTPDKCHGSNCDNNRRQENFNSHVLRVQSQINPNHQHNHHHHHENHPQPCLYPECLIGRQSLPEGNTKFQPFESHNNNNNNNNNRQYQNRQWSNLDPYTPDDDKQLVFTTTPTNHEDHVGESSYNHNNNHPHVHTHPRYPLVNRESFGRTIPNYSHSAENNNNGSGYRPSAVIGRNPIKEVRDDKRPIWRPYSGTSSDYHDSKADASTHYEPQYSFGRYNHSQKPGNVNGEDVGSLDAKLDSWLSKPHVITGGNRGEEHDMKSANGSSKTNIFNQERGEVGTDRKNVPSSIYVNVNGVKGHYITKEVEIRQNHSNTRHYTPTVPFQTTTHSSIANHDTFNNRELPEQKFIHSYPRINSTNEFNRNQSRRKPNYYHNTTQDSVHDHFNKSRSVWKHENTTSNNHTHNHLTSRRTIIRMNPKGEITIWQKPDTNVPSVSIDEEENKKNNSDENVSIPDEDKYQTSENAHHVRKYKIDVLNETDKRKPEIINENKNNKSDDNSVIMSINRKNPEIDHFKMESGSWQEEEPPFPVYYIPPLHSLGHVEDSKPITPVSGQYLRLRGGTNVRNGYLEVQGVQSGWGVVCDDNNGWTLKEANIVCRQLGYTRGAESAWQGRTTLKKTKDIPSWIATTSVHCRGNEIKFQMCEFEHKSRCNIERDAVGVSCLPNYRSYCREGEIPHGGNCYHMAVSHTGLDYHDALNYCAARNSRLVDITTQMENNFLSDWLMHQYPYLDTIMTSGIGITIFKRNIWFWNNSTDARLGFTKWWPGWISKKNTETQPTLGSERACIVLKKEFPCHDRSETNCIADYFFWDIENCTTSKRSHAYICKRPYDDISCVYGKGHQYSGKANISISGAPCLPWNDKSVDYPLLVTVVNREVREKLKAHNFCRNPNPMKESKPWCFTGFYGEQEYCDIPPCGNIGTIRTPTGGQCKKGHFECMPQECIPSHWVCDGEEDCTNGRDEESCFQHLEFFKRTPGHRLDGHDVEKWLNTPAMTCALRCKEAVFTCRSFSHKIDGNLCLLSDNNVGSSGSLLPTPDYDYYEMTALSIDCDGMFTCENKKCINQTQVCDGKNDCGDRSDENVCTVANLDYAIRLAGSENKYEGRVEVKFLGHWGQVCDDGFGMINAEVICHELGFNLGAVSVRPGGFFGNLEPPTRFMVDQLKCRGNETSLRECEFDGWGVHDCSPNEAVGIVCKTAVDSCSEGQWKCDNSPLCIPSFFICDEVQDCPDGSDESENHCKAPFKIRLVNGSSPREGRLEVRHHGVWGTVCDDDFSNKAAKVVCESLGYEGSVTVKKSGFFGPGEGLIWLDEVFCRGNETQLHRCEHNNWGHNNCKHDEDVGVICQDSSDNTEEVNFEATVRRKNIDDILPSHCGKRREDFGLDEHMFERVVRGSIAPKDSYPWQASIRIRGHSRSSHWCGAVIISPLHVLTAAHCLKGYNKGTYFVRAGDYNTEILEDTEVDANIEDYYIHEEFRKGQRMNNDIALVLLKGRGIPLGEHIMPICLPPANVKYSPGLNCTISGFGSIETGHSAHSRDLRFGWVPLIDQSICQADYVYGEGAISQGMLCAGYLDEGVDSCDGDSGGPLACQHNGAFTLYGITSWGQHCGSANKPGVYVRVAHYRDWIDKRIRDSLSGR